ncbi:putative small auxin-up RNA [Helianthus annuus]|uniref:Putative SAUR-like auxin-responsive protein family n=1 Tax=Helianthus annuus TaxID=4232 RepID=A0A251V7W2_HELAN|nr:auxin-responsive protein SAUR78 [Helianthus annuus]KAF5815146.1 putative small auxin-up RNA [Helianthus annuus]KAJ0608682.1 putative small auxin-up RNA [Helianthus annuus]KAJ0936472.1 putative small auxin-up RNA [Helianthus annuus]
MKKMNNMLRKCKTLSRQLVRTSSYTSLRSKSTTDGRRDQSTTRGGIMWNTSAVVIYGGGDEAQETVFVGSTRKRYVIDSKYLSHPVVNALIERSGDGNKAVVNCEVVLFDHLLWMLENSDMNLNSDSLDELAGLYSS